MGILSVFPRCFALELDKAIVVVIKWELLRLRWTLGFVLISGDGDFMVKVIRNFMMDFAVVIGYLQESMLVLRGVCWIRICVLFVHAVWRKFSMFSFDVTWLGFSSKNLSLGGFGIIGRRFVLSGLGCLDLILSAFFLSQSHILEGVFYVRFGGGFGGFEIQFVFDGLPPNVRRFLNDIFVFGAFFYGVLVDL
ncbi:hypothetical protein Tco_0750049 [Tanacetum coccineum]|uniref:Uncharacterized protein n=1 Tax=Tanacetum coccineum TaxID=301880 RepID=A0ABQ4Z3C1_9ASTR